MDVLEIINENSSRLALFQIPYNQLTGEGSLIPRKQLHYKGFFGIVDILIPSPAFNDTIIQELAKAGDISNLLSQLGIEVSSTNILQVENHVTDVRLDHDFEFWAITCTTIQDKVTKASIPFTLNKPQRRIVALLDEMRVAGRPIRVILLKARQWGGSTLVQMYMAWIQLRLRHSWHSAIIADVDDQARNIRNMYQRLSKNYPKEIGKITWRPFAGSQKTRIIHQRDCIVGIGSAQRPESLRSFDFAMLHLSEVSSWRDTMLKTAADLAQALQATVPDTKDTLIVLESTAKGIGNYFHKQWLNAARGKSIYRPVFVSWFEIKMYQKSVPDYKTFILSWGDYEHFLWSLGATIEGIYWYVSTKTGYDLDDWRMKSEYPSTATEAFQSSGHRVFAPGYIEKIQQTCTPAAFTAEIFPALKGKDSLKDPRIEHAARGSLFVWALPDLSIAIANRYCVFVDIGGRSNDADFSIIKVFDRYWMMDGGIPEVVAVWHGHVDQDLLAWKAAQVAQLYGNALLAVESNSLDKRKSDGDHFLTILDEIADFYDNLYARKTHDNIQANMPKKYGFHTNVATKAMIINFLNAALRDGLYVEKDIRACHEMDTYEVKSDGSYGAIDGTHDDHVIATAGGAWLCYNMELPSEIKRENKGRRIQNSMQTEASI